MKEITGTFQSFSNYAKKVYEKTKVKKSENDGGFLVPEKISIPVNKWNDFKQRFFPYWLQKIFLVKTKEVNLRELLIEHSKRND